MSTEKPLDLSTEHSPQLGESAPVNDISEDLALEEFPDYRITDVSNSEQGGDAETVLSARELRDRYDSNFRERKAGEF